MKLHLNHSSKSPILARDTQGSCLASFVVLRRGRCALIVKHRAVGVISPSIIRVERACLGGLQMWKGLVGDCLQIGILPLER